MNEPSCPVEAVFSPDDRIPCRLARGHETGHDFNPEESPHRSLGVYDGQPVMEGHHGRLVYDCEPDRADGCIIPVPDNFLGLPQVSDPEAS
jgi:hypothetical protein